MKEKKQTVFALRITTYTDDEIQSVDISLFTDQFKARGTMLSQYLGAKHFLKEGFILTESDIVSEDEAYLKVLNESTGKTGHKRWVVSEKEVE